VSRCLEQQKFGDLLVLLSNLINAFSQGVENDGQRGICLAFFARGNRNVGTVTGIFESHLHRYPASAVLPLPMTDVVEIQSIVLVYDGLEGVQGSNCVSLEKGPKMPVLPERNMFRSFSRASPCSDSQGNPHKFALPLEFVFKMRIW
jgi:hypothetical protein